MIIELEKAGSHPDQIGSAKIRGPKGSEIAGLTVGTVFHIEGQPKDVKWRVVAFVDDRA